MAKLFDIVEGWTQELGPFVLSIDGVVQDPTTFDDIQLILRKGVVGKAGGGELVSVEESALRLTSGAVYWTPQDTDLKSANSPYTVHWKVTVGGRVVFFPSGLADTIEVEKS